MPNAMRLSHMEDSMVYRVGGFDRKDDNQLWVVEAADQMTAAHIAELFRKEGYDKVKVEDLGPLRAGRPQGDQGPKRGPIIR